MAWAQAPLPSGSVWNCGPYVVFVVLVDTIDSNVGVIAAGCHVDSRFAYLSSISHNDRFTDTPEAIECPKC